MGTRHLIVVKSNKKTKVAQYGQWDGYPEGQGVSILHFLQTSNLSLFKRMVDGLSFYKSDKEHEGLDVDTNPELSRDTSAKLLNLIYAGSVRKVIDKEEFADDSLFCEWCYVIDLDKNTLEVYSDFGNPEITFHALTLVNSFDLQSLPSEEVFIEKLKYKNYD